MADRFELLKEFISDADLEDEAFKQDVLRLIGHPSLVLRLAGIGMLIVPGAMEEEPASERVRIQSRVDSWLKLTSKSDLQHFEHEAVAEAQRQIRNLSDPVLSSLDEVRRLELRMQRKLLEAVTRLLLRAKRVRVEFHITELDRKLKAIDICVR